LLKTVHTLSTLNKRAFAATVAVAMLGVASTADATPGWHLGQEVGVVSGFCDPAANLGMVAQVGYYGEIEPRTGDNPDSAVVIKVTAACAYVTAIPSFRLPPQVRRDTSFPIECTLVRANGMREALQTNMNGACSQAPLPNPYNLPNVFAWAGLDPGESLEVYMPIEYIAAGTALFMAEIRHSIQQNLPLFPNVQFNVRHAYFENYAFTNMGRGRGSRWGSWDGERVDISFALYNYFQSGNLVIEYGTTPSLGLNLGTTPVPNSSQYYPNVTASLTGLAENTQYYWRPKFITPNGTFYGAMQTFRTYAYLWRPVPYCPRFPCAI
jgi:hypothetical protein